MLNLDFIAFTLQFGIDLIVAIGIIIYLSLTYSWEKNSQVEPEDDFNLRRDGSRVINTGSPYMDREDTFAYTRNENSVSLLRGDGD